MTELEYLAGIYELLQNLTPFINLLTGIIQFSIVVFIVIVLYKLFNLFFWFCMNNTKEEERRH